MTYIDLLNDFNQWLESNALPTHSQLMYYKLLHVFNRAGWPETVQVDNLRMMIMTGATSTNAITRARDKLIEAGFIGFSKGKKGCPNRYSLKYRCKNGTVSVTENVTENGTVSVTENGTTNGTHIKTKTKTKTNIPPYIPPTGEYTPPAGDTPKQKRFTPPTVEEVTAYVAEKGYPVDSARFVDYYTSNGWKVGKNPMKDWKAAVRTWASSKQQGGTPSGNSGYRKQTKAEELDEFYKMTSEWANGG